METAELQENIRQVPDAALWALQIAHDLPTMPRICQEKNGRGESYFVLRYWLPRCGDSEPYQRKVYLGPMDDHIAGILQGQFQMAWMFDRCDQTIDDVHRRITHMRGEVATAIREAKLLAPKCGFYFHGQKMRRRRGGPGRPTKHEQYSISMLTPRQKSIRRNRLKGLDAELFFAAVYMGEVGMAIRELVHRLIDGPYRGLSRDGMTVSTSVERTVKSLFRMRRASELVRDAQRQVKEDMALLDSE